MGRINIPALLREHSHLEKSCVIVGSGDHMEIWNEDAWDQYIDANNDDFDSLSEMLDEMEEE